MIGKLLICRSGADAGEGSGGVQQIVRGEGQLWSPVTSNSNDDLLVMLIMLTA